LPPAACLDIFREPRSKKWSGKNCLLFNPTASAVGFFVDKGISFYNNVTMTDKKNILPLLAVLALLVLTVSALLYLNFNKSGPPPTPSALPNPSPVSGQVIKGQLECFPSEDNDCSYALFLNDRHYRLVGISQTGLVDAGFKIGDMVSITGQVGTDSIDISTISTN